ncbi:MAG: UDP-glucose/GDP-mannose dehydrogenase family protein [Acidimicrobiales bacterium]|nr:UDP-glucose/GDP-mannose dehydrogenase family protein [Acidimicrobiales bacterium]
MAHLAIIGTGYVGLTTGACLAHLGHHVVCADIDEEKVAGLSRGEVPIVEEGLGDLVVEGIANGRLRFVVGSFEAVSDCEAAFLCVPTPQGGDGSVDLSFIETAAAEMAEAMPPDALVVNKSTVPVGSTQVVERVMQRRDVAVVSNPEFLREGSAVRDFLFPDRIVIGSDDRAAAEKVASFYDSVEAPVLITDPASAETIKYASNAFLATKLSFVNALAAVCEGVGADVNDVVKGLGYDRRIGHQYLQPGPGWGGSCFPKDTSALLHIAESGGYDFRFLGGVIAVNEEQFSRVAEKARHAAGGALAGSTVAVWGLTFKAGTDDMRDSPALSVIDRLLADGATVRAFDPTVAAHRGGLDERVEVGTDPLAVCGGAHVLMVLTEWSEFADVEPDDVAALMAGRGLVDTRNLLDRDAWTGRGFDYYGIGR